MLMPSKTKYRKMQRGRIHGKSKDGNTVAFGDMGLRALGSAFINARQIESVRIAITRELKREGKLWIRIFPHKPYTKRAAESRMGSGKGEVEFYQAVVQPGRIMFEIGGVSPELARHAFEKAAYKLPLKTAIITKKN